MAAPRVSCVEFYLYQIYLLIKLAAEEHGCQHAGFLARQGMQTAAAGLLIVFAPAARSL